MDNSWRSKAPVLLIAVLVVVWVLADAMNVRLLTDSRIPTIDALLSNNADVESMKSALRSTAVHDKDAAHLIAACLLHENVQLRQAGRSVAHDRLDKWQLDSPKDHQRLVTWLSGSILRLVKNSGGRIPLTAEGREITQRMHAMAQRPTFVDRESCVSDCLALLELEPPYGNLDFERRPTVATSSSPIPRKRLTESIVAPVNFDVDLGVTQKKE